MQVDEVRTAGTKDGTAALISCSGGVDWDMVVVDRNSGTVALSLEEGSPLLTFCCC
jgi:hypothetical protein